MKKKDDLKQLSIFNLIVLERNIKQPRQRKYYENDVRVTNFVFGRLIPHRLFIRPNKEFLPTINFLLYGEFVINNWNK